LGLQDGGAAQREAEGDAEVEPGVRGPVGRPAVDQAAEEEQGLSSRDVDLDRGLTLPCCMPVGMAEDVGARQDVEAHVVLQGHDNGHVEALAERRPAVQLHRGNVPDSWWRTWACPPV